VRLGEHRALTPLGAPEQLLELCQPQQDDDPPPTADNPTLTADLLEIYFTSTRVTELGEGDARGDVWFARRGSPSDPFEDPQPLPADVNSNVRETSPAISPDGLTLWLGSERGGGDDPDVNIFRSTRSDRDSGRWSSPEPEEALNSEKKDIPRPLGQHDQVMPLASQRDSPQYATYFATRGADGAFGSPQPMPELAVPPRSTVDGFLTDDGLVFLFNAEPAEGQGDLYLSRRSSLTAPFEAPIPLVELNTAGDERDPWLNAQEDRLFFSSDRDGPLCIYWVPVELAR
jgi:hypothetical protein